MNASSSSNPHSSLFQRTVAAVVELEGPGLLTGEHCRLRLHPAEPGTGRVFVRTDLEPAVEIPALVKFARRAERRTILELGEVRVQTVEHLLAALAGLEIDNVRIELDSTEPPGFDGSAQVFVEAILEVGIVEQDEPAAVLHPENLTAESEEQALVGLAPAKAGGLEVMYDLDYSRDDGLDDGRIPRQSAALALPPETFATEIAPARTFCLEEEAEALRQAGLGRHHREGDMLVFGIDGPIATELRFPEEPARHKILDLIGDLALTGRRIQGRLFAARSGHELNRRLALSLVHDLPVDPKLLREGRAMDIRSIQRALPHRYPMLLVDRVLELDGDQKAIGIKNVSINEPFFQGHYPNVPIMPGVLIVEAMAQLGGLLVSNTVDNTGKTPVLLSLDGVKIRKPVTPGDQLVLEAETIQVRARIISVRCRATVAGTLAAEARIRFMLIEEDSVD